MIQNKTKQRTLSQTSKFLTTPAQHAKGLMFSTEKKDFGLIFVFDSPRSVPIHMMFVFYAIDVLWLDENKKVIDMREKIAPFAPYVGHKGLASYLIEVPKGSIAKSKTQIGDVLDFA